MMGNGGSEFEQLTEDVMIRVNRLCNEFEERWRRGERTAVEDVLDGVEEALRPTLLNELLPLEIAYRRRAGAVISIEQYLSRFPNVGRDWLAATLWDLEDRGAIHTAGAAAATPTRLGDYTIVRRVGSGGMGTVYEAHHERMGRTVAIKVLRPELGFQPQAMERFIREIRAAASLAHPNIVAAYDSREENGVAYLVTEFVEGMDLSALVKQRGPLPSAEAIQIVRQAARGLQYAHERGVVHRDIKPQNLMVQWMESASSSLRPSACVKILDFGLARLRSETDSQLTNTNMVLGTAAYMAPEQALRPKQVDHRADIYSLGCTMYYLLTGQPVYAGDTVFETALAHAKQPVPTLSALRPDAAPVLDPILGRMLAKEPAQRFQSMAAVIAELDAAANLFEPAAVAPGAANSSRTAELEQPSVTTVRPRATSAAGAKGPPRARPPRTSPLRRVLASGGVLALVVVGIVGFALWNPTREPEPKISRYSPTGNRTRTDATRPAERWALSFNGTTSYVEAASPGFAGEPVTLEAIVTVHETRMAVLLVWFHERWHAGLGLNLHGTWSLGHCRVDADEKSSFYGAEHAYAIEPVSTHQRLHLAAVFNGDERWFFVNGEQQQLKTAPDSNTTGKLKRIYVGRGPPLELEPDQPHPDRFFNGLVHAVRISQGIRYTSNFEPPAAFGEEPADDSIVAFNFEEGTGNVTHDVLGRATARTSDAKWVQP